MYDSELFHLGKLSLCDCELLGIESSSLRIYGMAFCDDMVFYTAFVLLSVITGNEQGRKLCMER